MRIKIFLVLLLLVFLSSSYALYGWASNEPVKGWYDAENDWFVFEWVRPGHGKTTTIYDPPNKVEPVMLSNVSFDRTRNDYLYEYKVTNMGGAQLLIDVFITDISSIHNPQAPSSEWYMNHYRRESTWYWSKTGGDLHGIPAGETVRGFSFRSQSPPAIVNSVFFGKKRAIFSGAGDFDTDEVEDSFWRVYDSFKEKYPKKYEKVVRRTLGPLARPTELDPVDFLDSIIGMKHEAFSLGWITNKGIERSLDAKLDAARKKLTAGDYGTARNILNAFMNEVEAQGCETRDECPKGKHLLPEAYALLKYNAQYLADNLK